MKALRLSELKLTVDFRSHSLKMFIQDKGVE